MFSRFSVLTKSLYLKQKINYLETNQGYKKLNTFHPETKFIAKEQCFHLKSFFKSNHVGSSVNHGKY